MAQEVMVVERIRTIDQTKPIFNIHVDEDNNKWIANATTVYFVPAKDIAEPLEISPAEQSLLQLPGGDYDLRWNKQEIKAILGDALVTTAAYNRKTKELWIGTDGYGLFKLRADDSGLRFLEQMHIDNSKLRSDFINSIYITPDQRIWVGTQDGALVGEGGQWKVFQKFFNILRIAGNRQETWAIGDGLVWIIDNKDNWQPYEINPREIEGTMHDIAVDQEGKIWIASNIMTSYKIATDRYEHFGPGQYFTSQFVNYVSVDDDNTIWVGTDDKGVYIIEKESTITVTTNIDKPVSCDSTATDGQASVRAIGGTPPYTINWSHGASGDTAAELAPGLYTITVTDTEGGSKTASLEINDPRIVVTLQQEQAESDLNAGDGVASMHVEGGAPPYNALWSNGSTAALQSNLTEGLYTVTVTDQIGCTGTAEIEITREIRPLAVNINAGDPIRCPGGATGSAWAEVSGGREPFRFAWAKQSNHVANGDRVSNLSAGTYLVQVTDELGATATATITIEEPDPLELDIRIEQMATTGLSDGRATATATGGTPPYAFSWSNDERGATASQLAPHTHTLAVTDANGCLTTATVQITEDILPLRVALQETGTIRCPGEATGGVTASVSGGKGPFSFQWNNGQATADISGLTAGQYAITVTDATGTTTSASLTLESPEVLSAKLFVEQPASTNTADGRARIEMAGGTPPYQYRWDSGESESVAVQLAPGERQVTVTDAQGCTLEKGVMITEDILPLQVDINALESSIECAGQATAAVRAGVSGGKGPFTYQWSTGASEETVRNLPAGLVSLTVTDATGTRAVAEMEIDEPPPITIDLQVRQAASTNGEDGKARARVSGGLGKYSYLWDNGETTAEAERLAPGVHTLTVTDEVGCTATGSVEIQENILPLSVSIVQTAGIECAGDATGVLQLEITGGKGPFISVWSNKGSGSTQSNLVAGTYTVTLRDAAGGRADAEFTLREPDPLQVTTRVTSPASTSGADGKAEVSAQGGTGRYTFSWDNGETGTQATALTPGTHTVTVTDAAGCTAVGTLEVSEDILPMSATLAVDQGIRCAGAQTGAVSVQVDGGKGPYTYRWSDGAAEATRTGLGAGTWSLTLTDAMGTEAELSITLEEPAPLSLSAQVTAAASTNNADGKASVKADGGTTPYTFAWDNGESGQEATRLAPGDHVITVTDANGCTATTSVSVSENILPLAVNVDQTHEIRCADQSTATAQVVVTGGKEPYSYAWSHGAGSASAGNLAAGDYSVTVSDATGQEVTAQFAIRQPEPLTGSVENTRPAAAEHVPDGKAEVVISGGTAPYVFKWDNGETTQRATKLGIGSHVVDVSDANGCSVSFSFEIAKKILPELTAETLESGKAVRMEQLHFEADSSNINQVSIPTLTELYQFLYDNPTIVVEVGGHTNGLPEHEYCDRLSTARAKSVAQWIVQQGIDEKRVFYKGYGKRRPIATNRTPEGRRKNQRVEVRIVRLDEGG
ncbi:MAG: OmpA family protein [Saprospiraceae bacterium]|nr:OmpA family protein [Saprospiraceae bacterium]